MAEKRAAESIPEPTRSAAVTRAAGTADYIFLGIVYFIAFGALIVIGLPLIYIVAASFSDGKAVIQGRVFLWPVNPTLEAYKAVISYPQIGLGFRNSFFYVVSGTFINVAVTVLAAYPLSRKELHGRNTIMFIFSFTMFFSGGLIPTYVVVMKLNLLDKIWAILIPSAMSVWMMIIARTFFQTNVPDELYEATLLDGGNDLNFLIYVVLPISKAVLAVLTLMYAVGRWNSYFEALIYLTSPNLFPLQVFLRRILVISEIDVNMMGSVDLRNFEATRNLSELLKYALIVVSSVPVMVLYPFVQKYFVQGVMIGSIKG